MLKKGHAPHLKNLKLETASLFSYATLKN